MKKASFTVALAMMLFCFTTAVHADFVTPADYTGALSWAGGGVYATDGWAASGTSISWNVTDNNNGTWTYSYSWTAPAKELSHILIEVTPEAPFSDFSNFSASSGTWVKPDYYGNEGGSSPGIPGTLYSIKLDATSGTTVTFGFTSTHAPVWGDFYAKDGRTDGQEVYAYNTGFLDPDTKDGKHIVVPDGQGIILPEPGTMILLGLGLLGLGIMVRKRS